MRVAYALHWNQTSEETSDHTSRQSPGRTRAQPRDQTACKCRGVRPGLLAAIAEERPGDAGDEDDRAWPRRDRRDRSGAGARQTVERAYVERRPRGKHLRRPEHGDGAVG